MKSSNAFLIGDRFMDAACQRCLDGGVPYRRRGLSLPKLYVHKAIAPISADEIGALRDRLIATIDMTNGLCNYRIKRREVRLPGHNVTRPRNDLLSVLRIIQLTNQKIKVGYLFRLTKGIDSAVVDGKSLVKQPAN